jgi:hypothetical protein
MGHIHTYIVRRICVDHRHTKGHKFSEGASGAFMAFSSDSRYMVKSLKRCATHEQNVLRKCVAELNSPMVPVSPSPPPPPNFLAGRA